MLTKLKTLNGKNGSLKIKDRPDLQITFYHYGLSNFAIVTDGQSEPLVKGSGFYGLREVDNGFELQITPHNSNWPEIHGMGVLTFD